MNSHDFLVPHKVSLSERVSRLEATTGSVSSNLIGDLRMIETHVSRAEEHLLRYERVCSSWTRPDLLIRMVEKDPTPGSWQIQEERK